MNSNELRIINGVIRQIKRSERLSSEEKVKSISDLRRMKFDPLYWRRVKFTTLGTRIAFMFAWDETTLGDQFWLKVDRIIDAENH